MVQVMWSGRIQTKKSEAIPILILMPKTNKFNYTDLNIMPKIVEWGTRFQWIWIPILILLYEISQNGYCHWYQGLQYRDSGPISIVSPIPGMDGSFLSYPLSIVDNPKGIKVHRTGYSSCCFYKALFTLSPLNCLSLSPLTFDFMFWMAPKSFEGNNIQISAKFYTI